MDDTPNDPTPTIAAKAPGLFRRVLDILLQPSRTWGVIVGERSTVGSLYLGYILPLAAIGPIAQAVGGVVFGDENAAKLTTGEAVIGALMAYVLALLMTYLLAVLVNALAPIFGGRKDFIQALKLVAYAGTAGWVAEIVYLLPTLAWLSIAGGIYGLFLMFLGLPRLMKSPPARSLGYMIVVAILNFIIALLVGFIVNLAMIAVVA